MSFFLESPYSYSFALSSTAPFSLSLLLRPRSARVGLTPENFLYELICSSFQLLLSSSSKRNVALANLLYSSVVASQSSSRCRAPTATAIFWGFNPKTLRYTLSTFNYLATLAQVRKSLSCSGDVY